jgi:hypothetical protein
MRRIKYRTRTRSRYLTHMRWVLVEFQKSPFCKSYVKDALPRLTPAGCTYKILA